MNDGKTTYEVVGSLPPGGRSRTLLVLQRGPQGFVRHVVFRELEESRVNPPAEMIPGVVPFIDVVRLGAQWYGVYEFSAGVTLGELLGAWVGAEKPIPLTLVGRIVFDAARVLHQAHAHRDALGRAAIDVHGGVGEASIQIGFDGQTRVLDFGARRNSRFLAPEAVKGSDIDFRADIFSLAATAHWALAHYAGGYAALMSRNPSDAEFSLPSHTHPEATPAVDAAIRKGLFPDPESRPGSMREWVSGFERALGSTLWTADQVAEQISKRFAQRHGELVELLKPRSETAAATGDHKVMVPIGLSPTAEEASPDESKINAAMDITEPLRREQSVVQAPFLEDEPKTVGARPANTSEPVLSAYVREGEPATDGLMPTTGVNDGLPRRSVLKRVVVTLVALTIAVLGGLAWLAKDDPRFKQRFASDAQSTPAVAVTDAGSPEAVPARVDEGSEVDAGVEAVDAGMAVETADAGVTFHGDKDHDEKPEKKKKRRNKRR